MNAKDNSMLYANDNLTIDDFLGNNTPNLYSVSGNDLRTLGMNAGKAASSRIYSAGDEGPTLGGYYRKWTERNGYSADSINAFRENAATIPELQQAADAILAERGVYENLTGANLERARQSVINGIIDGAIYKEESKPVEDRGKISAGQAASLALQKESMNRQAAAQGLVWNGSSYVYDVNKDPSVQRQIEVAKKKQELGITDGTNPYKNIPTDVKNLWLNKGNTSNGTVITTATDSPSGISTAKISMKSSDRYPPFFGDAWNPNAGNGFQLKSGPNSKYTDGKPYSMNRLKSDEAKDQLRNYVIELLPDVVEGLNTDQLDKVIGFMDFQRDYDTLTDSHFMLRIPGVDDEGKIVNATAFNRFLSEVNKLKMNAMISSPTIKSGNEAVPESSDIEGIDD